MTHSPYLWIHPPGPGVSRLCPPPSPAVWCTPRTSWSSSRWTAGSGTTTSLWPAPVKRENKKILCDCASFATIDFSYNVLQCRAFYSLQSSIINCVQGFSSLYWETPFLVFYKLSSVQANSRNHFKCNLKHNINNCQLPIPSSSK